MMSALRVREVTLPPSAPAIFCSSSRSLRSSVSRSRALASTLMWCSSLVGLEVGRRRSAPGPTAGPSPTRVGRPVRLVEPPLRAVHGVAVRRPTIAAPPVHSNIAVTALIVHLYGSCHELDATLRHLGPGPVRAIPDASGNDPSTTCSRSSNRCPAARAADLGCGTGRYTPRTPRAVGGGRRRSGIDASARMLAESRRRYARDGIDFVEADLADLATTGDAVDVAVRQRLVPVGARPRIACCPASSAVSLPAASSPSRSRPTSTTPATPSPTRSAATFGLEPLARDHRRRWPGAGYAEMLWAAGLRDLDVTLRIYGVEMDPHRRRDRVGVGHAAHQLRGAPATPATSSRSVASTAGACSTALGDPAGAPPYFYAFPRILCRGRLP